MSLIWADGFDHYGDVGDSANMALAGYNVSKFGINTDTVRTGAAAIRAGGGNNVYCERGIDPVDTLIMGVAIQSATVATFGRFGMYFRTANGNLIGLWIMPGDRLAIFYNGTQVLISGPNTFVAGAYNYLEMRVFMDAANATVECRRNGVLIPDFLLTGQTFTNSPIVAFGMSGNPNDGTYNNQPYFCDDLYVMDTAGAYNNDFQGDIRCRTFLPATDGPEQDWTATGGGSAYSQVDNVPYQAGQYIAAAGVGDKANFGKTALPINTAFVAAVQMVTVCNKTDAGSCQVTPQLIGSDGTSVANGDVITPGTGTSFYAAQFDVDPASGAPFTRLGFDSALMQLERTA